MKLSSSSSSLYCGGPKETAFGCLSGLLHRFLSGGSLCNQNYNNRGKVNHNDEQTPTQSCSIVARLMGLESMPVARSGRSPTYLIRQENEEFLILSFSPDDNCESFALEGIEGGKKTNKRKQDMENRSQNSWSPTSVFDHPNVDFDLFVEPESPVSDGGEQQSSRRKLSSHLENNYCSPSSKLEESPCGSEGMQPVDGKRKVASICEHVCRVAEEDLKRSRWVTLERWTSKEEAEKIAVVIGMEIFDLLLCEEASELSNYIAKL
ncbi:uncharacterized protein [Typha angustifolia]|uniref:uncharacterized protein n=1 Tax=Typha angustifolia TaxID=59011 RepID=UPI003C2DF463